MKKASEESFLLGFSGVYVNLHLEARGCGDDAFLTLVLIEKFFPFLVGGMGNGNDRERNEKDTLMHTGIEVTSMGGFIHLHVRT